MHSDQAARIEIKLDMIIRALQGAGVLMGRGELMQLSEIREEPCPLCEKPYTLSNDVQTGRVRIQCGCRLPINDITPFKIEEVARGNSRTPAEAVPAVEPEADRPRRR
jgi:hypothetical protein